LWEIDAIIASLQKESSKYKSSRKVAPQQKELSKFKDERLPYQYKNKKGCPYEQPFYFGIEMS
jgi:hypothetical protein